MTEHPNLAAALVAALTDVSVVEKTHTADTGSFKYDYADIAAIVKATRPALAAHGIVALTPVEEHGQGLKCTVVLLHSSGERMEFGPFPFPHGRDAQATGSLVTYYRRYALVSALGIAAGQDTDANGAEAAKPQERAPEPNPKADPLIDRLALLPGEAQNKILAWFNAPVGQWASFSDAALDKLAEQISKAEKKVEASTEPSGPEGGEGASNPPVEPPAPPVAPAEDNDTPRPSAEAAAPPAPVTKPATKSPAAAARAALAGEKPALGAVKRNNPVPDEEVQAHFPGSEVVDEGSAA